MSVASDQNGGAGNGAGGHNGNGNGSGASKGNGAVRNAVAVALRADFDAGFAEVARTTRDGREAFLAVRAGGDPFALRLDDVAGLHRDRKIVPIPSPAAALLGLASFRGTMTPIYDLAALLGYPPSAPGSARWLVVVRGAPTLGLAFEAFGGHFRANVDGGLSAAARSRTGAAHLGGGVVQAPGAICPLVDLSALRAAVAPPAAAAPSIKEP